MLRVKDGVDLKELGFDEYDITWFNKKSYIQVDKDTRRIRIIDFSLDALFDLITSGLVEKVVEE